MDRNTPGSPRWAAKGELVGEAPFVKTSTCSRTLATAPITLGLLAVRAAAASGVNVTYKILYNDAVAMTGGQHVDGPLTVPQITLQVTRGRKEDRGGHRRAGEIPLDRRVAAGVTIHHRDDYDRCNASSARSRAVGDPSTTNLRGGKRRRRKRNQYPEKSAQRAFINDQGVRRLRRCGGNPTRVGAPLETEFRPQAQIDHSHATRTILRSGFCPSFVTVTAAACARARAPPLPGRTSTRLFPPVPTPRLPCLVSPTASWVPASAAPG